MYRLFFVMSLTLIFSVSSAISYSADWTRFRGPNGKGISEEKAHTPTTWNSTENLKWKIELPGPGSSSPIVVGDRVYITCWTGYGVAGGDPGDQSDLRRHLICIDKESGKTIWSTEVEPVLPEDRYGGMFAQHGYASHTPVSDGERIYVYFGKTGAFAYDLDGNKLWQTPIGTESDPRGWGSASSPVLYEDLVIITAPAESQAMVGLDKKTGKEVWRQEAAGFGGTWGTPVLVKVDDERTDLVLGVPYEIWGLDPANGQLTWYCEAMETDSFCSSVAVDDDVVYAIEGRGGGSIAVKVGGKDDVTETHKVWMGRDSNRIGTPIVYEGRIYFFSNGIANCIDAKTGGKVFQSRLEAGADAALTRGGDDARAGAGRQDAGRQDAGRQGGGRQGGGRSGGGRGGPGGDYASPVLADGKIYFQKRSGEMYVIKADDEFEQLAANRLTDDTEDFSATPAISDGQLFIRSDKHLYCVAE